MVSAYDLSLSFGLPGGLPVIICKFEGPEWPEDLTREWDDDPSMFQNVYGDRSCDLAPLGRFSASFAVPVIAAWMLTRRIGSTSSDSGEGSTRGATSTAAPAQRTVAAAVSSPISGITLGDGVGSECRCSTGSDPADLKTGRLRNVGLSKCALADASVTTCRVGERRRSAVSAPRRAAIDGVGGVAGDWDEEPQRLPTKALEACIARKTLALANDISLPMDDEGEVVVGEPTV